MPEPKTIPRETEMEHLTDIKVAVARIEEKLEGVADALTQNVKDRREDSIRLTVLERQQEKHIDSTVVALRDINRQLAEFIVDSKAGTSASADAIKTISVRLEPLEEDLRHRTEKKAEAERRHAESDRNVRRIRNGVGLIAGIVGMFIATKAGLMKFLAWLVKG